MWVYVILLYKNPPAHVRNLTIILKDDTLLGCMQIGKLHFE